MKPKAKAPKSEQELLERAQQLAGLSLGDIANAADIAVPSNLRKEKGWIGLLLEHVLGATAGTQAKPDFDQLGIELKTIPIDFTGKPLETTFVSVAPLVGLVGASWQNSHIREKLARVLWVPIVSERALMIKDRIVATPFIWSPNEQEEQLLANDWQELTDMIVLGEVEKISGKYGQVLQLRPKAANSQAKTKAFDKHGNVFMTLPRGFYLKTQFTHKLIEQHLRTR
ncbi:DNA mismatch repair endonuclease MutH [Thalassotalea sp. LPB0316]|uniref:DNA mismatch repair endonuclease MutH n=1 Tax=Thalassotalea sp. LPB0316 TaxID=2769490 RepID=UPI001865CD3B|nr:DNA mismatch repair endonuclease MutH [Thalassotalea sp. LPB0316]QOL25557.1 DNA mismatch repair endonuclease MutH [Thalassotalea sp. LPB0316]